MNRVQRLVDEFLVLACVVESNPDHLEKVLTEMVNEILLEDRLRSLNVLQIVYKLNLTEAQKLAVLGDIGETDVRNT